MSNFIPKFNPITGLVDLVGQAKLVQALNNSWQEYRNEEGETKRYKLANAVISIGDKETPITLQIHEKNMERMEENGGEFTVGQSYLTTINRVKSNVEGREDEYVVLGRMSHLTGVPTDHKALLEAFDDMFDDVETAKANMTETAPTAPVDKKDAEPIRN